MKNHDVAGRMADSPSREGLREAVRRQILSYTGSDPDRAGVRDVYRGLAFALREYLAEKWIETQRAYYESGAKRIYYLSLEFLVGRSLMSNILSLGLEDDARAVVESYGHSLDDIEEMEWDAGLGNGGLGRLASCFMDSLATQGFAAYGYGIRYDFGIFWQVIENGAQTERPDNWMRFGCPWQFERQGHLYPVQFGGSVRILHDEQGNERRIWVGSEHVLAVACDMLVPGYRNGKVINMRLWNAKASREFALDYFQRGDYVGAVEEKAKSENISKVLYPDDSRVQGQELRLKQQYFFVAATIQDIVRRSRKQSGGLAGMPDRVAVQLNDTHPAIAIPELMRVLVDEEELNWDDAWSICVRTFAYTNHTILPEALEHWPVETMQRVLPRHMEIIYEINARFLQLVRRLHPGDDALAARLSIIDEDHGRRVRMAHLALVGSHMVNGVSALHTDLLRSSVFQDFHDMYPRRFVNMTNGVTPRRWMLQANPLLSDLITEAIGPGWETDLARLRDLRPLAEDAQFRQRWREVKFENKKRLSAYMLPRARVLAPPEFMFDVHVKRIHEYKRQLLNVLHVVTLYNRLRGAPPGECPLPCVPRVAIFGGKAAPAYAMAKLTIRLIHAVASVVNGDPHVSNYLRVAFVPNYCVSNAEKIIPGTDLSEQISTAGTEASGTGNMKFAMNGALTIGTMDGATVEMAKEIGDEHFFIFGLHTPEVAALKARGYDPRRIYDADRELRLAVDMIANGHFSPREPGLFEPIRQSWLDDGDKYMVMADYRSYVEAQERAAHLYQDREEWTRVSILNTAGMGYFSSDRTIAQYAREIWGAEPVTGSGARKK
ncbi:starch phosphorylase [Desulfobaculum xiamenense]|uniref:Alpha-1,4 glucan phosphorylase n=1 Tax=Desulfobaculum xiamenense TaxID=995050 RepID=A0A846QQY6_9BACT|nr:glycogen/starch/alpha-glucan phosphorylase [Desulfobaculum xiamenense]NJB68783.1 starch phosphorylase [Desulfobaculum xiamenense]